jgi:predicted Zn-dependent peptidase
MKKTILKNGLKVIYQPTNNDIVVINMAVLTSAMYETEKRSGISHFLEHMVFEGTKNRTCHQLSSEIEQYGGEMNAYTSNEKTNFYIKIHKKHVKKAIEILADILTNPSLDKKAIKKEKKVIAGEIKMIKDEPRHYQWQLFQGKLFDKPFSNRILGSKKTVFSIKKKDLINYHNEYYISNNMIITVVGQCKNYLSLIKKYFKFNNNNLNYSSKSNKKLKNDKTVRNEIKLPNYIPVNTFKDFLIKKKNLRLQYLIIGYQTPLRSHYDSFVLDIIAAVLAKGQSGKLFNEIRTKRGLTYNFGIYHNPGFTHSYFAFYANAEKQKIPLIQDIFFNELNSLKKITFKELNDAKSFLEGQITLKIEDSQEYADTISLFEECGNYKQYETYIKNIKKVTKNDVKRILKEYLNTKYTKIILT